MIQKGMPLEAVLILEVLKNLHPFTFDTPKLTNLVLGREFYLIILGYFCDPWYIDDCVYRFINEHFCTYLLKVS